MKDSTEKGLKPLVVGQSIVEKVSGRACSCRCGWREGWPDGLTAQASVRQQRMRFNRRRVASDVAADGEVAGHHCFTVLPRPAQPRMRLGCFASS